jgi:serine/threonine protein kinase
LYVLALDYMPGGTVADRLAAGRVWPEHRVVREIRGLLGLLDELHRGGATHRDVTPQNVFVVGERRLVLGDFGIARHGLGGRPIYADAFAEAFVPRSLRAWSRTRWLPSDDVYQVALLAVSLLCGCEVERAGSRELARLPCSPDLAEALRRALGPRRERYPDAAAMLAALAPSSTGTSEPRSLRGRRVALVGQLPVPKTQAAERVRRAGGHPQSALNGRTDVLVAAPGAASRLRREVSRRRREGQSIAMIRWSDFERLAPPTYRHGR